jgi:hypothetical protein
LGRSSNQVTEKYLLRGEFSQIFSGVISRCEKEEVELFSIIARRLWHRRNVVVHGGEFMPLNQVVKEAVTSLEDFQRVNQMGEAQVGASENRDEEKW